MKPKANPKLSAAKWRGTSRLLVDGIAGITGIVDELHRQIVSVAGAIPSKGKASGRTQGITGLVYKSVRGVTNVVGVGLEGAFTAYEKLAPLMVGTDGDMGSDVSSGRGAALSALNGVFGDYLAETGNPLAIPMQLHDERKKLVVEPDALTGNIAKSSGKVLVLVHGLCMNDLQWNRDGHDHGISLAANLGYTPLYLNYNSGRRIALNGENFAVMLEQLVQQWPVPVTELAIIGHSMGGLVARTACEFARTTNQTWLKRLKKLIFLGTPHHGAPLERAGHWVDILLGMNPYSAPFVKLGAVRSTGIKDLGHGTIVVGSHSATDSQPRNDRSIMHAVKLPIGVKCFFIAATKSINVDTNAGPQRVPVGSGKRLSGDGLVPVNSALGIHKNAALTFKIQPSRRKIFYGLDHFDLLSSREVYDQIYRWLAKQ